METQLWTHITIPVTIGDPGVQAPALKCPDIQRCWPTTTFMGTGESLVVGGRSGKTQSSAFQLTSLRCWTAQTCVRRKKRRLVWGQLPSLLLIIFIEHHHQCLASFYLPWKPILQEGEGQGKRIHVPHKPGHNGYLINALHSWPDLIFMITL